jgi:hypothetical protein
MLLGMSERGCPFLFSDAESFDPGEVGSAAKGESVLNWIYQESHWRNSITSTRKVRGGSIPFSWISNLVA